MCDVSKGDERGIKGYELVTKRSGILRKRSRVVHTRVTEEQFQKLKQEAEKQGITIGHLIRRRLTRPETPSEQPLRPYAPKYGRRLGLTPQQKKAIAEQYIKDYPEILKQVMEQTPQVREPPKTMEELTGVITRDSLESGLECYTMMLELRQQVQKMLQQRQTKEDKLRCKEERLWQQKEKRIERKVEQFQKLLGIMLPLLQAKQEE